MTELVMTDRLDCRVMVWPADKPALPLPVLYLSGEVGDLTHELLVPTVIAAGLPDITDARDGVTFVPAAGAWEVRCSNGIAGVYFPVGGQDMELFPAATVSAVPGWVEAADAVECCVVMCGPALPFTAGHLDMRIFDRVGDRPLAGGLVEFVQVPAQSEPDRES